jgi:hypothetical protein
MAKNLFLNYRTIEIDIDMDIFNPESSNNESSCKTPTIAHVLLGIHIYNQLENPVLHVSWELQQHLSCNSESSRCSQASSWAFGIVVLAKLGLFQYRDTAAMLCFTKFVGRNLKAITKSYF